MKTNCLLLSVLAFCAIQFTTGQITAKNRNRSKTPGGMEDSLDRLISDYAVNHQFMGSVLVAETGKVLFKKGYGLANVEKKIPNTPGTRFAIGSITKQFTAMLVTQLAEKGKIRLDGTLSDYLPEFPQDVGKRITIEMLLLHTSGLRLPEGIEKYYYATRKEEWLQEFIRQNQQEGLRFEPGRGYGYSNGGYFILGLVIEKVTGKSYEEVLSEQILKPLAMKDTLCDRKGLALENRAASYRKLRDGSYISWNEEANAYDPAVWGFGCGNILSTVEDLFRFSQSLATKKLLSRKYLGIYLEMRNKLSRHMMSPEMPEDLIKECYGTFGNGFAGEISIINDPVTGEKETLCWHDGTNKLFMSQHYHYREKNQVIIICGNSCFRLQGDEMALKIHRLLNNRPHDQILIKRNLKQYLEEDIAMHAGIPAALDEYVRFKDDTAHFSNIPDQGWFVWAGRTVAEEMGDLDNAVLVLKTGITSFPDSWQILDALGETYLKKGDTEEAIQCFQKSLDRNPGNENAKKKLAELQPREKK